MIHQDLWSKQIDELREFCKKKKWSIVESTKEDDEAEWDTKKISLNTATKRNKEVQFYIFLHEVGHMLMWQRTKTYRKKYSKLLDGYGKGTQIHCLARVEEEYEAWRAGFDLAKKQRWQVNEKAFERIKAKCIMTYFLWATEKTLKRRIGPSTNTEFKARTI